MRLSLLMAALFFSAIAQAQSFTIKGRVTDSKGLPLAGASVHIKRTSSGTATTSLGEFLLRVNKLPITLQISSVGFGLKEVFVSDTGKLLAITLLASEAELSEVVVVGYGTRRRRADVSYATASIGAPSKALVGKVAGVLVTSSSKMEAKETAAISATDHPFASRDRSHHLLTAGELSDFKKWGLWKDYSTGEFEEWSERWKTKPVHRYCVQVQDQNRNAIVGERVYLFNSKTGDTTWQGITDNSGKAELWAPAVDSNHHYAIGCNGATQWNGIEFEKGINRITLKKDCHAINVADIAFVVDATGSMGDEIAYLQAELMDVITNVAAAHKDVQLRTGAVFYKDHGDEYLTKPFDFTTSPAALVEFIKQQAAGGGGDTPEAVDEALQKAIDGLTWSSKARSKVLFLVLDAPPHFGAVEKMNKLARQAAAQGIRIVPIVCSGADKGTEYLMRSLALRTNGSYVFLTDDSGIGETHLKPTTDEFKVELLNDLLRRVIGEMLAVTPCGGTQRPVSPVVDSTNGLVKVSVYPNPSQGRFTVEASKPVKELYVTDFSGKVLFKVPVADRQKQWSIDLGNYPSATYWLKYFVEGKGWATKQVVVVR